MSDSNKEIKDPVPEERHTAGRRNDEIDLLDLFLVLVRYRKLILGLTAAAVVISIVGYFFYPAYQYRKAAENNYPEVRLEITESAALRSQSASYNLQEIFTRPKFVLQALQNAGFTEYMFYGNTEDLKDEENRARILYLIQQRLIDNKSLDGDNLQSEKRIFTVQSSGDRVMLIFKDQVEDRAGAFIESLYQLGKKELENKIEPYLKMTVSAHEQLMEIENPGENLAQRIVTEQQRYDQAKKILAGEENVLARVENAYKFQPEISLNSFRSDFKIKGIVLTAAVFLLSIFLAFVLNLISNIRNDEESMRKIRKALNKE